MKSDATRALALQFFEAILKEYTPTGAPTVHVQRLLLQFGGASMRNPIREIVNAYRAANDLQPVTRPENESAPSYADGHAPRFAVVGEKTAPLRAVPGPSLQPAQPQPITAAPQNAAPPVAGSEPNAAEIEPLTAADLARIAELGSVRDIAKEFGRARLVAYLAEKEIDFPETARDTQIAGFVLESLKK